MKKKRYSLLRFNANRVFIGTIFIALSGLLLFLYSCKKDQKQSVTASNQPANKQTALENSAYTDLKLKATPQVFNDLDWTNVKVITANGVPSLLWIKSKSTDSKYLLYSKRDSVVNTRWVQLNVNNGSGKITSSSINETEHIESNIKNGRIYAAQKIDERGNITVLNINKPIKIATNAVKNFKVLGQTLSTNAECDPGGGGDPGTGTGSSGDGIGDGGTDGSFTWSGVNQLPEVVVSSTTTSGSVLGLYSLYILMGNNPSYGFNYTPGPNGGGSGSGPANNGMEASVPAPGGGVGTDPGFKKGKTPATGVAKFAPFGGLYGGWQVNITYTITTNTKNGVTTTTPTVTANVAATFGAESMIVGWQTLTSTTSVTDQTINFSFNGYDVYGVYNQGWHDNVTIDGTYNTSTGVYSIYVHRAP
ncbi:hypothetical protein [Mucilaginibacter lappiensis]|uniref:Uncharacterized protein n=1 Tax=Mucilaginibacter lappiensis TaxID=354630 RepID=A0A841JJX5_9SPHI|nr:hypothetical protein [Mucilaginibacter lappiensis]MBB6131479.1 hypothetical protein [Mucilaginibacter lappiensis]